ncbi:MAG: DMT family transporter [Steroidobacteraceae bacterium]
MSLTSAPNAWFALAAAGLWGGGDFSGGMGVKHAGGSLRAALRVVLLSHATSCAVLVAIALLRGDPFPHGALLAWGVAAGVAGGLSLTCFYIALSRGAMGVSAAVSGLLAAAIPALVASFTEGFPGARRIVGFCVAGAAIWLIAAAPAKVKAARSTAALAIVAGAGFGIYFVALKMAGPAGIVWPMATARMGSLTVCSLWAIGMEASAGTRTASGRMMNQAVVVWSLSTALLDTSGNLLFVAATRAGRLDVAAVLSSLYPASTILLAAWMLHERPTCRQAFGMAVAVLAVVLITFS